MLENDKHTFFSAIIYERFDLYYIKPIEVN